MNETIDPTQWLHQSFYKAYPHAMKRVTEHNGRLTVSTQFAFDELYSFPVDRPILDANHLSAAEFITTLHNVAFFKTDLGRLNSIVRNMSGVEGLAGNCPMTLYLIITRDLDRLNMHMVERLCFKPIRTNDWGWIEKCRGTIRESFDRLGASIEKSLDILKTRLDNSPMNRGQVSPKFDPIS